MGHSRRAARTKNNRRTNHRHVEGTAQSQRCEDQDYIHSWLAHVDEDNSLGEDVVDEESQWRPHNLDVPKKKGLLDDTSTQRKMSWVPRDSPLLPSTVTRDKRSPSPGPSNAPPSSASGKENKYARRARRKTREDRYDTNKHKSKHDKTREATKKPIKQKVRKHELRSGKQVMDNFTSNAISNDRVTIKPNFTTGLFSNARVPQSAQIGDLAFNDMNFLSRENHRRDRERRQNARDKDKRKIWKDMQEEADFFDHKKHRRSNNFEAQESSPIPESLRKRFPREPMRHQKLEGAALQGLKLPLNTNRPASVLSGAHDTPSLPSLPKANCSNTKHTSWSASPVSARRKRREPAESPKEPSISDSPIPLSALRARLLRTGVFDFHDQRERSVHTVPSTSEHGLEIKSPAAPEQAKYEDKGVMNSPWPQEIQKENVEPQRIPAETRRSTEPLSVRHSERGFQHEARPLRPVDRVSASPFSQLNSPNEVGHSSTFHQLHRIETQPLPSRVRYSDQPGYWVGPRLPQILPSLAKLSQEISDTQQLGQHWHYEDHGGYAEPAGFQPQVAKYHDDPEGLFSLLGAPEPLNDAYAGGESVADFIARVEAEVLGRHDEPGQLDSLQQPRPNEGPYSHLNERYYPGWATRAAGGAIQPGWAQETEDRADTKGYDETEMTAFWRPNRFL